MGLAVKFATYLEEMPVFLAFLTALVGNILGHIPLGSMDSVVDTTDVPVSVGIKGNDIRVNNIHKFIEMILESL